MPLFLQFSKLSVSSKLKKVATIASHILFASLLNSMHILFLSHCLRNNMLMRERVTRTTYKEEDYGK